MADIVRTVVVGETLVTDVSITFADWVTELFSVSSFMPKSKEEVLQNVAQFELSAITKRDAEKLNEQIAKELEKIIE